MFGDDECGCIVVFFEFLRSSFVEFYFVYGLYGFFYIFYFYEVFVKIKVVSYRIL